MFQHYNILTHRVLDVEQKWMAIQDGCHWFRRRKCHPYPSRFCCLGCGHLHQPWVKINLQTKFSQYFINIDRNWYTVVWMVWVQWWLCSGIRTIGQFGNNKYSHRSMCRRIGLGGTTVHNHKKTKYNWLVLRSCMRFSSNHSGQWFC